MMWNLTSSKEDWSLFLADKFKDKNGQWTDQYSNMQMKVKDLMLGNEWIIPSELQNFIHYPLPPITGTQDEMVWSGDMKGIFSTSAAVDKIRHRESTLHWPSYIWKPFIHPGISSNIWKIQQGVFVDDQLKIQQGYSMVSMCCICKQDLDSMFHLLWSCSFSIKIWQWLGNIFHFSIPSSLEDVIHCAKNHSPIVKQIWLTSSFATMRELWFLKNRIFFDNAKPNENTVKSKILSLVHYGGYRMKATRWTHDYDSHILEFFKLGNKGSKFTTIRECVWLLPPRGVILFCCNGIALVDPGLAGFGIIYIDHDGAVVGTISGGLGIASSYIAKSFSVIWAFEWENKLKCDKLSSEQI
ncbi:uncharacterized protein LOC113311204 [Papaver somniferum]|uniref:uncharacterized protein LOC113311204 n=1 Tax=Papaver somniferum TaxID=3469 RepID=UPI000E7055D7|nr:uncharacterized protein LOC113311204 [Papaver somniferum]